MTRDCQFELQPLYCHCGAYVGELGTCEDFAICSACNSEVLRARFGDSARTDVDVIYSPAADGKYKYDKLKVHRSKA